jgi:hypothetical protein
VTFSKERRYRKTCMIRSKIETGQSLGEKVKSEHLHSSFVMSFFLGIDEDG